MKNLKNLWGKKENIHVVNEFMFYLHIDSNSKYTLCFNHNFSQHRAWEKGLFGTSLFANDIQGHPFVGMEARKKEGMYQY